MASEHVAHDDLCPVCQLLLFTPVRTQCNHLLCASCMAQWADASSTTQIEHLSLDVDLVNFDPKQNSSGKLEANCPMCRTHTTASPDKSLARQLKAKYPMTYAERRQEEEVGKGSRIGQEGIEDVVILIGNKHGLITNPDSANVHLWTFFVRTSRPELIDEVHVDLDPTFRPSHRVLQTPPYELQAEGWGYFTIGVKITMRAPYDWVIDNGRTRKHWLELSWTLDFEGGGSQGRVRAKAKRFEDETNNISQRLRSRYILPANEPHVNEADDQADDEESP